jgi:hypothetical protein
MTANAVCEGNVERQTNSELSGHALNKPMEEARNPLTVRRATGPQEDANPCPSRASSERGF